MVVIDRPLSVCTARKSNVPIQAIMGLHFPEARVFYDTTWGKGVFWQDFNREGASIIGSDIDPEKIPEGGFVADCRDIGWPDDCVDVVVVDLPFMHDVKDHSGTRLFADFGGIGNHKTFVSACVLAGLEAHRLSRQGFVIKCKDTIESGHLRFAHVDIINELERRLGKLPYDMLVFVPDVHLQNDPKWGSPQHFRRQESYFLVYKK